VGVLDDNLMWAKMVLFVLRDLEELLLQCRLYPAVRVLCYGIIPSHCKFFGILEKYNPDTCTFFTSVEEMGFVLHEMFEVSGCLWETFHMRVHSQYREIAFAEVGCAPGVQDLLGNLMLFPYLCSGDRMEV